MQRSHGSKHAGNETDVTKVTQSLNVLKDAILTESNRNRNSYSKAVCQNTQIYYVL